MEETNVLKSRLKTKGNLGRTKKRVRWWDEVDETATPWDSSYYDASRRGSDASPLTARRRTLFNWFEDEISTSVDEPESTEAARASTAVEVAQFPGWLNFQAARKEKNREKTPQSRKSQVSDTKVEQYIDDEGRELLKLCSASPSKDLSYLQRLKSLHPARLNKESPRLFPANFDYARDHIFGCPIQFM